MTFEILDESTNEFVDITPYIAFQGLTYQRSDVDAPDAGRDMSGFMHRGRVTIKDKWQIKFRAMRTDEIAIILQLIAPEQIQVHYLSPYYNSIVISAMYVGDRTAQHCIYRENGEILWKDLAFSCIEL